MSVQSMSKNRTMGKQRSKITKPFLHISLFDWRVSMVLGFLLATVICTAPTMIGTLLLFGLIVGTITLVNKDRI